MEELQPETKKPSLVDQSERTEKLNLSRDDAEDDLVVVKTESLDGDEGAEACEDSLDFESFHEETFLQENNGMSVKLGNEEPSMITGDLPDTEVEVKKEFPDTEIEVKKEEISEEEMKVEDRGGAQVKMFNLYEDLALEMNFSQTNEMKGTKLQQHAKEKPYECEECGRTFAHYNTIKRHKRIHTGEKPYICNECGKSFRQMSTLKGHQSTHSGTLHKCEECGKLFSQPRTLKAHMRLHTKESLHVCEECGKAFIRSHLLRLHMVIHTGETPYTCDECGATFNRSNNLRIHKRAVHLGDKPYVCEECGKSFMRANRLTAHLAVHAGKSVLTT